MLVMLNSNFEFRNELNWTSFRGLEIALHVSF